MRTRTRHFLVAIAAVFPLLAFYASPISHADTAPLNPADPKTPITVAMDGLPTTQINGVAWHQVIIGNTVYVAGSFSNARPAGAAPGVNTVTRNNLLAYNLTTGALITSFAPNLNGQALAVAASPDGSRIYVGGSFTTVNGVSRNRIAALNAATGALVTSFAPSANGQVRAIVATDSTVYFGGMFTSVSGSNRNRLAAAQASNGALLSWAPNADGGKVNALAISPDRTQVVVGGAFTTLNGSNRPGYGLGAVHATTGALLPFAANNVVRNAGNESAILSLSSDSTNVYGTGYIFGTGGNLEGAFSANWSNGAIRWIEDCHGDSYGVWPGEHVVYVAGHPHYCLNLGGFPNMVSGTAQRAVAFSKVATCTLTRDTQGYPSFTGQPCPSLLNWYPQMTQGSASGQSQAAWAVTGNANYVVMAGEFPSVNNIPQQGLVRFAVKEIAPNKVGPRATGDNFKPTLSSPGGGQVRFTWPANFDYDNAVLTYRIFQDGSSTPLATITQSSTWWQRPQLTHLASGIAPGTHSYRMTVADPFNNTVTSPTVSINVGTGPPAGTSAQDTFSRTVTSGLGTADQGGPWSTLGSASYFAVNNGSGVFTMPTPGAGPSAYLGQISTTDSDTTVRFWVNKISNGSSTFVSVIGRRVGSSEYLAKVKVASNGAVTISGTRLSGSETTLQTANLPFSYSPNLQVQVRMQVEGTSPTTIRAKAWPAGTTEPGDWQILRTDSGAGLQSAGSIGLRTYLSSSSTNAPVVVRFDDLN